MEQHFLAALALCKTAMAASAAATEQQTSVSAASTTVASGSAMLLLVAPLYNGTHKDKIISK
uniref:Uncharacterized protein n=2 Tax=gambiae species complex TaxID=44542 RepID=A0A182IDC4_ANOAR